MNKYQVTIAVRQHTRTQREREIKTKPFYLTRVDTSVCFLSGASSPSPLSTPY